VKPAARVLDKTNHGGVILGPVSHNVFIGGLPAARLLDKHVCPMVDGVKPHAGGIIAMGSVTVSINGLPAARVGDMTLCVGPPGAIASGCPTVLIGG
jgi:uncharacterized Zn-binding protein involved in type VI secretion